MIFLYKFEGSRRWSTWCSVWRSGAELRIAEWVEEKRAKPLSSFSPSSALELCAWWPPFLATLRELYFGSSLGRRHGAVPSEMASFQNTRSYLKEHLRKEKYEKNGGLFHNPWLLFDQKYSMTFLLFVGDTFYSKGLLSQNFPEVYETIILHS